MLGAVGGGRGRNFVSGRACGMVMSLFCVDVINVQVGFPKRSLQSCAKRAVCSSVYTHMPDPHAQFPEF